VTCRLETALLLRFHAVPRFVSLMRRQVALSLLLVAGSTVIARPIRGQATAQAGLSQAQIVFESQRDGNRDIYVMDIDGGNVRRLTHTHGSGFRMNWEAKWSPDRTRIAFVSNRDVQATAQAGSSQDEFEIYVMEADGGNLRRLTHNDVLDRTPAWSPDGSKIAFVSNRDGTPNIYVMDADGANVRRLTHRPAVDADPCWSPDGNRIVFASSPLDTGATSEIYVMDAVGSGVRRLTNNDFTDIAPAWSPDGVTIAFSSLRDGHWEIYVMNADGLNVRRLTRHPNAGYRPRWSGDGSRIIFQSTTLGDGSTTLEDGGSYEIAVMASDGSNIRRLTFNHVFDAHPDW